MSKQRRIDHHFFPRAKKESEPGTREGRPHMTRISKSVATQVTPDDVDEKIATPLESLKPLAGERLMQVKRQYALDDEHELVVAVPNGPFAPLVFSHELSIPDFGAAFAMARMLELDDLAGPLMVDVLVMLDRIKDRVRGSGSISIASKSFDVKRMIGKSRPSVKLSFTTQAGTMLAALARDELAKLAKLDHGAIVAWQDRWSNVTNALSEWQGKPIEPTPIEPPTSVPIILAPYFPDDLVVQLASGRDGTAGNMISADQMTAMVGGINALNQGPRLSIRGCAIMLWYSCKKRLTLVRCRTAADVHVMGTASRLLRADPSCAPLVVAAVEEWGWRRVGLVDPVEQPRFAHPRMIQNVHMRERSDQAMFKQIPGIEVHGTAEASLNDLVISRDGKAQAVQLKASSTVMTDGKATACFRRLDAPYDVVVMSTGQLPSETRMWACVSTHKDREHRGLNMNTLEVPLDRPESKVMKAMEGLVVFDKEVGKDGTWAELQREMHIAIVDKVFTYATTEHYDQLATLCKEVPATAVNHITEDINTATFLRMSGFKGERGETYTQVDLSIETAQGAKRVQIKSVRINCNFWYINFGRGTYDRDSFDFLVAVLGEEGYWMIPMDALVTNRVVHTDGRASMTGFAARKEGNHWTARYWTTACHIFA
jgi:hypothetical protein